LDAVVSGVGHIRVSGAVHRDANRGKELAVSATLNAAPPGGDEHMGGRELLDAGVEGVGHIHITGAIQRYAVWGIELPVARTFTSPLVEEHP